MMKKESKRSAIIAISILFVLSGCYRTNKKDSNDDLLVIKEQGSFTVGGTVIENSGTYDV